ncbi:MAG: hypothetical protein JXA91_07725 [Candidatus Thermoplasmatota archaeon]|nr:hypothetical protein [Candidatus Thermoplasmatota archaeon]
MVRQILFLLLSVLSIQCLGSQDRISEGLSKLLAPLTVDPTIPWGFNEMKGNPNFDTTIKFNEIMVGTPVSIYYVNIKALETLSEYSVPSIIYKTNKYLIPLYSKGRCFWMLTAYVNDTVSYFSESECCVNVVAWNKFREVWPEKTSLKPIVIDWGSSFLIHFPEKDSFNLMYLLRADGQKCELNDLTKGEKIIDAMKKRIAENKKIFKENPCLNDPSKCSGRTNDEK